MKPRPWEVKTVSGYAGGDDRAALVTLEVRTEAEHVEDVRRAVEAVPVLAAALAQALAYVTRKEAHQGCMNAEQLRKAEEEFTRTCPSIGTGRWVGDMVFFDLDKARAALALIPSVNHQEVQS